jgi:hypothetical protein
MAGLIDGEGHITISKSQPGPNATRKYVTKSGVQTCRRIPYDTWQFLLNIGVTSTDKRLIAWIEEHFGGTHYTDKRQQRNWRCAYRWRILGRSAQERFLLGLLPYLVIKREQANLALAFIRMGDREDQAARKFFYGRFMELNRRGGSPETNTPDTPSDVKIESGLYGDIQNVAVVIQ